MPSKKFDSSKIDKKWQDKWLTQSIYSLDNMLSAGNPFYNLWMYPYPSAEGLHAGHAFASTGSDVIGRYMRMNGKNVFQPIGYDSFGIHSENFALKKGIHPKELIKTTTKHYEEQLKSLGHGYDWKRTVTVSDPDYYKWTQWLFLQMFKVGLAYRRKATVNWCPSDKTVLSDEQVMTPKQAGKEPRNVDGTIPKNSDDVLVCERCGTVVEKKELEQWFLRITDYADELLKGLETIDWSEKIKIAQINWIGKKEGINIDYQIKEKDKKITVWTSRPDTNFGATFIVVAPEYVKENLLNLLSDEKTKEVDKYVKLSLSKSKDDRISEGREKTGVATGLYAVNFLDGYEMPVYVADFVLAEVGTGAVVGVPGHDLRDFEFANKFSIPIKRVVVGKDGDKSDINKPEQVQEEEGVMVNSEFLDGLDVHEATKKIMDYIEEKGHGKRVSNYHLRDWLISRQRYWGPPIPMIYCEKCAKDGRSWFSEKSKSVTDSKFKLLRDDQSDWDFSGWYPVNEADLPVSLPDISDYKPEGTGKGPLAKHREFYETVCPFCKSPAKRETDVSDTFVDSSWYFLRYPTVGYDNAENVPFDPEITKKWLPVNLYFGGAEHAVLHLMYARFVTMVLHDVGNLNFKEPFTKFFAHGLMIKDGAKMSKSRGNVVNPDEYIKKFGADTLRLYLMFMGPMDGYPDFRDTGIEGMRKFTERIWNLFVNFRNVVIGNESDSNEVLAVTQKTIKKVTEDIEMFHYNTAISAIMEFINLLREKAKKYKVSGEAKTIDVNWDSALKSLCLILAPFAPHITEEVWVEVLGQKFSVHTTSWPKYNPALIKDDVVNLVVQVNGKLRGTLVLDADSSNLKEEAVKLAKSDERIKKWLEGKEIVKEVFVPGKLVNFVVI